MKFRSKKDLLFTIIIFGLNIFFITMIVFGLFNAEMGNYEYWTIIPLLGVVILLFWMYFGTKYSLTNNLLTYQCGPIKGKINIDRITEIEKGKTLWVGLKPATSRKGLIIKYDKYNEIYISPKTNDAFISKILEIKSDIIISE